MLPATLSLGLLCLLLDPPSGPWLPAVSMHMIWLPYSQCPPAQVMKLAIQHRRKALTFVSSVGVASPLGITDTILEDTLGTDLATEFPGSGGYAYGYGAPLHAQCCPPVAPAWNTCASLTPPRCRLTAFQATPHEG